MANNPTTSKTEKGSTGPLAAIKSALFPGSRTPGGEGVANEEGGGENQVGLEETDFWAFATAVASRLGLSMQDVKDLKESIPLIDGEDLRQVGNYLQISKKGAAKLMGYLGVSEGTEEAFEKKEGAELVPLYVLRLVKNPRLLLAVETAAEVRGAFSGQARVLRVQVRDNTKFSPGMLMETCRHVQADLYRFEGRPPRRRGHY
jgi:hypothetical protein